MRPVDGEDRERVTEGNEETGLGKRKRGDDEKDEEGEEGEAAHSEAPDGKRQRREDGEEDEDGVVTAGGNGQQVRIAYIRAMLNFDLMLNYLHRALARRPRHRFRPQPPLP